MKQKFALIVCTLFFSVCALSQQWDGSTTTSNNVYRYGDVSAHYNSANRTTIGAAWGGADIGYGTGYLGFNLSRNNHSNGLWQFQSDGSNNGGAVIYSTIFGDLLFSVKTSSGSSSGTVSDFDIKNNIRMRLNRDGKLIIGNVFDYGQDISWPGDYRLYVDKGILTQRVKVALKTTADWSDHVFHKNYRLPSFAELEKYIRDNKHLPGIPSAEEMVKQGNDLGQTDAKLLEKIEELTLYILQINNDRLLLEKQVSELKEKINQTVSFETLQKQITELKKEIEQLKK